VRYACEQIGFFYIYNHGVPQNLIDRTFAASKRFHAIDMDRKLALRLNENNIGYLPINALGAGRLDDRKGAKPNQNESFFVSHDRGAIIPTWSPASSCAGATSGPTICRASARDVMAYVKALEALCTRHDPGVRGRARSSSPPTSPRCSTTRRTSPCACSTYPPQAVVEDNQFGQAPHTDNSFMTVLARTDVPGLAVRLTSGEWFPPPLIPGTLLVNLGNMMRRFSNDRFLSTPARRAQRKRHRTATRWPISTARTRTPSSRPVPGSVTADNPPNTSPAVYRRSRAGVLPGQLLPTSAATTPRSPRSWVRRRPSRPPKSDQAAE